MKKITTEEDLKMVLPGSILYKDIREGTHFSAPDFQNNKQASKYQVHKIAPADNYQLATPNDEVPDGAIMVLNMVVQGIDENPPVLNKSGFELLKEGIWWLQLAKN